jgi:CubicO group peptidase (beta-lactamase class C family)
VLEDIGRFIVGQLATWEVPGCAVAVVRDTDVVLAAGWGHRDVAADLPVTADTLFAIGSVTKAFTAATIGALADDGLLGWDTPVRDYLPGLRLADPAVSDRVTVTDLLSHRSGMARHDLAWLAHPEWSRAELVRRLRFLPFGADLRQEFRYCNLGYALAGHLVDVLSGASWEEFLRTRLLTPLGMDRSNLSVDAMRADPDHATGYDRDQGAVVPVPARQVGTVGPAGAINSCARDMARWLLAQAGGGAVDGTPVLSPGTVARQHTAHMLIPEDRTFPESTRYAYGFGWLLGQYRGHRIAEHGGGIDGYVSECLVLPDDRLGVVVLTNTTSGGAFAPVVAYRVLDELLGLEPRDWSAEFKARYDAGRAGRGEARDARRVVPDAPPPRPPAAYAGEYEHPGYGTFSVAVDGDTLRPRFGALRLSLAHRHYEVFDLQLHEELGEEAPALPVTFLSDPDGFVTALTVPFDLTAEPIRFDRLPDAQARDPQVLRRLCGTYTMGPVSVDVSLASDTVLTVTVPGSPPLELRPGPGLRFEVQGAPGVTAEFELDEAGAVTRLIAQPIGIFHPVASATAEQAEAGH